MYFLKIVKEYVEIFDFSVINSIVIVGLEKFKVNYWELFEWIVIDFVYFSL